MGVVALWTLSGFYIVLPDQQAVETVFGRVAAQRVLPGLHYAAPWPVGRVMRRNAAEKTGAVSRLW